MSILTITPAASTVDQESGSEQALVDLLEEQGAFVYDEIAPEGGTPRLGPRPAAEVDGLVDKLLAWADARTRAAFAEAGLRSQFAVRGTAPDGAVSYHAVLLDLPEQCARDYAARCGNPDVHAAHGSTYAVVQRLAGQWADAPEGGAR